MKKNSTYINSIDAVRSVAMMGVILFHMLPSKVSGGFLGVITFLVLAGYLSMRAIMLEGTAASPLRAFQSKIKKLLPSLILMIFATVAVMTVFLSEYLPGTKSQAIASLFGINNIIQILDGESYFAAIADIKPFTHIWALSLEMQFYALMIFTAGRFYKSEHRNKWMWFFGALTVVSVLLMNAMFTDAMNVTRIYYGPDTRLFSFSIGAFGALWFSDKKKRVIANDAVHSALTFGVIIISAACFFTVANSESVYRYIFLLYSLLQLSVIYLCSAENTFSYTALGSMPFRVLAARSYALYLCHFPIIKIFEKLMWGSKLGTVAYTIYEIAIVILITELFYTIFKQRNLFKSARIKIIAQRAGTVLLTILTISIIIIPYQPHGEAIARYEMLEKLRTKLDVPAGGINIGRIENTVPDDGDISTSASESSAPTTESTSATAESYSNTSDSPNPTETTAATVSETQNQTAATTSAATSAAATDRATNRATETSAASGDSEELEEIRALFDEWKAEIPQISITYEDYLKIRNKRMTIIGDSISVMIAERFVQLFPNAQISAQVNRQTYHAYEFYNVLKSEGRIGEIIILALGANGDISYSTYDEVRADTNVPILVSTVILPWPVVESERNASIHEYAKTRSGVGVIKWNEMCKDKAWLLYDDGVHPKDSGAIAYSLVMADAIYSALAYELQQESSTTTSPAISTESTNATSETDNTTATTEQTAQDSALQSSTAEESNTASATSADSTGSTHSSDSNSGGEGE